MLIMFYTTGPTHRLQTIVFGEESHVTMSPSMSSHCKPLLLFLTWVDLIIVIIIIFETILLFFGLLFCICVCSNLSGLNLDGEISPAIGNLKRLQSMYSSPPQFHGFFISGFPKVLAFRGWMHVVCTKVKIDFCCVFL